MVPPSTLESLNLRRLQHPIAASRSPRRAGRSGLFALLFASAVGFAAEPADAADLTWAGCHDLDRGSMNALAEAFQRLADVTVTIEPSEATQSIRAVARGDAQIGCSGRRKTRDTEERGAKLVPIGWDALVAVTSASNPVKDVSLGDLKSVLEGKITNWRGLGGPDAPIELLVRDKSSSSVGTLVRELLFQDANHVLAGTPVPADKIEQRVQASPFALAITSLSTARSNDLSMLNVAGVEPSRSNIVGGKYPLIRPLYLVVGRKAGEQAQAFVKFAKGPDGQQILKREGTINLADGTSLWLPYRKAVAKPRGDNPS